MTLSLSYYHARREDMWKTMRHYLNSDYVKLQPNNHADMPIQSIFEKESEKLSCDYKSLGSIDISPGYLLSDWYVLEFQPRNRSPEPFFIKDHDRKSKVKLLFTALEFYVNLDLTFYRLKSLANDANERLRADIAWNHINKLIEVCKFNEYG